MAYCDRANVYAIGLPPEAFARPPRPIEDVVPSAGTFLLRSHGLATDQPVTLIAISSSTLGAAPAALPTGLTPGVYYARPIASDSFAVSLTVGGSVISNFADAGSGILAIIVDHGPYLDAAIVAATAVIDVHVVAHRAPIRADVLPLVCSYLAARIYVATHAAGNPVAAKLAEPPTWLSSLIDKLLDLWLSGAPLPSGTTDATPTVAEDSARLVPLKGRNFLCGDSRDVA